jgi:hypothetical protein
MQALRDDPEQAGSDSLWPEALWGLGLIGAVLTFAVVLVTVFGV